MDPEVLLNWLKTHDIILSLLSIAVLFLLPFTITIGLKLFNALERLKTLERDFSDIVGPGFYGAEIIHSIFADRQRRIDITKKISDMESQIDGQDEDIQMLVDYLGIKLQPCQPAKFIKEEKETVS